MCRLHWRGSSVQDGRQLYMWCGGDSHAWHAALPLRQPGSRCRDLSAAARWTAGLRRLGRPAWNCNRGGAHGNRGGCLLRPWPATSQKSLGVTPQSSIPGHFNQGARPAATGVAYQQPRTPTHQGCTPQAVPLLPLAMNSKVLLLALLLGALAVRCVGGGGCLEQAHHGRGLA